MAERTSRGPLQVFDGTPDSINDQLRQIRDELDELHNATTVTDGSEADEGDESGTTVTVVPVGAIFPYGGTTAPTGYLLCDGSAVSRTTYDDLFGVISTTFGVGDGSTTFNVPDLRGRHAMGKAAAGTFVTMGSTGGAETDSVAAHTHNLAAGVEITNTGAGSWSHTTESGGSGTVDVLDPYVVTQWVIKT